MKNTIREGIEAYFKSGYYKISTPKGNNFFSKLYKEYLKNKTNKKELKWKQK